jgi:hypothetical protein
MTLTDKFINGLTNYGLSYEQIKMSGWKYCGGNKGRHLKYFNLSCPGESVPDKENECVCGHKIEENCYITNGTDILILGNCCVKRFIDKNSRSCETCGGLHKNRLVNRCNRCRIGVCDKCSKKCNPSFKKCYLCS